MTSTAGGAGVLTLFDGAPRGPWSLAEWAFGFETGVPSGGFVKEGQRTAFLIKKPWGQILWRRKVYNKTGTFPSKQQGARFMETALQDTFTQSRLQLLATGLGAIAGRTVALNVKQQYESKGFIVTIR